MKKYRAEKNNNYGIRPGTDLFVDETLSGFKYKPTTDEWFMGEEFTRHKGFSPIEEEFQEGQYRFCKTNKEAYRVNKKFYDGRYEILWLYPYDEPDNLENVSKVSLEGDRVLGNDAVEEHLIAEAKRRGYRPGRYIVDAKYKEIESKINRSEFEYISASDELLLGGKRIYYKGKWASIVDEPIQINGHEVTFQDDKDFPVKVGCSNLNIRLFTALRTCIDKFDCSIYREGEDITSKIKQIAERL